MNLRIIDEDSVRRLLPMRDCIEAVAGAFWTLCSGDAVQPLRAAMWLPDRSGLLGLMPGYLGEPASLGIKVVSVFPKNHGTGYDSHQGAVLLFDVAHGMLLAVIDGGAITAIRTAAASAVATRLLARAHARTLALLGSGVQAQTHLEAMRLVRELDRVRIWSRNSDHARAFAESQHSSCGLPIEVCDTAEGAVRDAGIICTVTASNEPVLRGEWIAPGAHINAIGACLRHARELDSDAVARARLFVDWRESALHESGDFLIPKSEGRIGDDHILGDIGELLLGRCEGRCSDHDVTLFKSLGLAVQDLAAANLVYQRAIAQGIGVRVPFGGVRDGVA